MAKIEESPRETSRRLEGADEWMQWVTDIPEIPTREGWRIAPLPPFGGAVARMRVWKLGFSVSVYLDCYDRLGFEGAPYWEIYPAACGDIERYSMDDVESLAAGIGASLMSQAVESGKDQ